MNDIEKSLQNENNKLKAELFNLREELNKFRMDWEKVNRTNQDFTNRIKFLEGQIEAYQYCMNCRRY